VNKTDLSPLSAREGSIAVTPPAERKVLVVDDDAAIRLLLTDIFSDLYGWTVTAVADAPAALAALAPLRPALIVLDRRLPGLDGIALYQLLRARPDGGEVPVLFVSADARAQADGRGGRVRWLTKPFALADLCAAVDTLRGDAMLK